MSPTPADEPSAGVRVDQLVTRPASLLGGEHQRPIFGERSGVDEISEVLARGAVAGLMAAGDGVGPGGVERHCVAGDDRVEVLPLGRFAGCVDALVAGRRAVAVEHREQLSLVDRVADRDLDAEERAADVRDHLVLHLHRLEHDHRRAGEDRLLGPVGDRDHGPRERCLELVHAGMIADRDTAPR